MYTKLLNNNMEIDLIAGLVEPMEPFEWQIAGGRSIQMNTSASN
jgi:hypothetical protein